MNKFKLRFATLVCGVAVCGFCLTSCAEDWDDFFTQHADDIAARDAEDAAIRADLQTEINKLRTEITGKIATVESKLHDLIEQGGQDVLTELANKSQQTRSAIDTRYAQFTALMDTRFGAFQTTVNNLFNTFATQRSNLEAELNTAIAQNNTARANEIQAFINQVKAMQSQVQSGVAQINALQTEYAAIISQANKLAELEQRMNTQVSRYDAMLAELSTKIQEAEERFEAAKEVDLSELAAAEVQDYKDKLAEMNNKLTQMQQALDKMEDMYSDAQQLVQDFSDISDRADDMASLLSDISDAYDQYSKVEDILADIDAIDVGYYEDLYENLKSELEQADQDMVVAAAGLADLKAYLESGVDDMNACADECETNMEYCVGLADDIRSGFDAIPFPN